MKEASCGRLGGRQAEPRRRRGRSEAAATTWLKLGRGAAGRRRGRPAARPLAFADSIPGRGWRGSIGAVAVAVAALPMDDGDVAGGGCRRRLAAPMDAARFGQRLALRVRFPVFFGHLIR
ncbi:hypothetical protein GUJ93_ZPchr0001g30186 [Zizania palustris]|uniref:Uncharacterized protein n=1 Tax=Zizania palustris TaxID=103762 RepID=A0A8J5RPQ8_ZIZPA|nr:hypothetical protein GUJ93_ZPchr0001g30186 [Zizania palustris]